MIWGGCKNRVVVGLNLSISSLFVYVHSLCYSTSIKRSGRVPLCSQSLPGMTASCSGLPQLPVDFFSVKNAQMKKCFVIIDARIESGVFFSHTIGEIGRHLAHFVYLLAIHNEGKSLNQPMERLKFWF